MNRRTGWTLLIAASLILGCVLSSRERTCAAPPGGSPPFGNSVAQRDDMLAELKEINAQLKELNALLRSGDVKVTVEKGSKDGEKAAEKEEEK